MEIVYKADLDSTFDLLFTTPTKVKVDMPHQVRKDSRVASSACAVWSCLLHEGTKRVFFPPLHSAALCFLSQPYRVFIILRPHLAFQPPKLVPVFCVQCYCYRLCIPSHSSCVCVCYVCVFACSRARVCKSLQIPKCKCIQKMQSGLSYFFLSKMVMVCDVGRFSWK